MSGEASSCCYELCLAVPAFPESVLEGCDEVVVVQVLHDVAVYNEF